MELRGDSGGNDHPPRRAGSAAAAPVRRPRSRTLLQLTERGFERPCGAATETAGRGAGAAAGGRLRSLGRAGLPTARCREYPGNCRAPAVVTHRGTTHETAIDSGAV